MEVREIASILSATRNQSKNRTQCEIRTNMVDLPYVAVLNDTTEYNLCVHQNKTITTSVAEFKSFKHGTINRVLERQKSNFEI